MAETAEEFTDLLAERATALAGLQLPDADEDGIKLRLAALAQRLGFWVQMLAIANGWLRCRVDEGDTTANAIEAFEAKLNEGGLTEFDQTDETERNRAISICIEASLEDLNIATEQPRLNELAILPEDTDVPIPVVIALWAETGGFRRVSGSRRQTKPFAARWGPS